jgi:hypothetical protein
MQACIPCKRLHLHADGGSGTETGTSKTSKTPPAYPILSK